MTTFEEVLFSVTGLHQVRIPRLNINVFDTQAQENGRATGRYSLSDLLEGDFAGLPITQPAKIAEFERAISKDYDLKGMAGIGGLPAQVSKADAAFSAKGARKVCLSWINAQLTEADQGELERAILASQIRDDGPLARGLDGLVITAVARAAAYKVQLVNERGGAITASADMLEKVAADLSASVELSSDAGLVVKYRTPIPFAVRCLLIKRRFLSNRVRILTPRGPQEILGGSDQNVVDAEYADAVGLVDNVVDLA